MELSQRLNYDGSEDVYRVMPKAVPEALEYLRFKIQVHELEHGEYCEDYCFEQSRLLLLTMILVEWAKIKGYSLN